VQLHGIAACFRGGKDVLGVRRNEGANQNAPSVHPPYDRRQPPPVLTLVAEEPVFCPAATSTR
jgi:hypothetical protein